MDGLTKKQHLIPQFYLRKFARMDNAAQIGTYLFESDKCIERTAIHGQACENYYYDRDNIIEKCLSELEGKVAPVFNAILEKESLPQTQEHLFWLREFISNLHGRTSSRGEETDSIATYLAQEVWKDAGMEDWDRFEVRTDHPSNLALSVSGYAGVLLSDLKWVLLSANNAGNFITSDNPVVLINPLAVKLGKNAGSTGFACRGILLFFPLSSELLLCGYDSLIYRNIGTHEKLKRFLNKEEINQINALQILFANKALYFSEFDCEGLIATWNPFRASEPINFLELASVSDNSELLIASSQKPTKLPELDFVALTGEGKHFDCPGFFPSRSAELVQLYKDLRASATGEN